MCTDGPNSGCICEESDDTKECPSKENQPECSDEKCAADKENKCTKDHSGCSCIPQVAEEECPKYGRTLNCQDCGGNQNPDPYNDDDNICKGVLLTSFFRNFC